MTPRKMKRHGLPLPDMLDDRPRAQMRAGKREKLFHAIVFFVERTKHCHKLKLFKLLYFLDFEIFRQTGKSTTGLRYFAWPLGPVPVQLQDELEAPLPDMRSVLSVHIDHAHGGAVSFTSQVEFDESYFTARELEEMRRLAEIYDEATGELIKLASHAVGLPWRQIYEVENRHQALIPYTLALDGSPGSVTEEEAKEIEQEARELAALFE